MLNLIQELKLMRVVNKMLLNPLQPRDGVEWHPAPLKLLPLFFSHSYRAISDQWFSQQGKLCPSYM